MKRIDIAMGEEGLNKEIEYLSSTLTATRYNDGERLRNVAIRLVEIACIGEKLPAPSMEKELAKL